MALEKIPGWETNDTMVEIHTNYMESFLELRELKSESSGLCHRGEDYLSRVQEKARLRRTTLFLHGPRRSARFSHVLRSPRRPYH